MNTCILMGGLGNQLFQIFTLIAYSINNNKFLLPEKLRDGDQRHTYWNNLLINLQKYISDTKLIKCYEYNELNFHYNQIPFTDNNLVLNGYFQSYKYFDSQWEQIFNIVGINELINQTKTKYNNYFNKNYVISMHFRLGDYVNKQDCHPVLDYEYYKKSIDLIINQTNINNFDILYFCEENDVQIVDLIISNLQNKFSELKFIKIDFTIVDWEQMLLYALKIQKHQDI